MSASINCVILLGRLGQEPELKQTSGDKPMATFSLATDESYTDSEGKRIDKSEWHRVVAFGKQAENIAKFLHKGSRASVEGSLQTRTWEEDGQKRYMTEIKASRVQFIDPKKSKDETEEG